MSYEIIRKAESFKRNTKKFMDISKELLDDAIKDSMSISTLAYMDAEQLAMIGKFNEAIKSFDEMFEDYCDFMKDVSVQLDKLDRIENINTKLAKLAALDDKLDRIEEKIDRLDMKNKQSNK